VVFVLCTTEAHKIPATIASRCQHFSFRSVDFDALVARMAWICGQEGIQADPEALAVLAQAGEGSVRDSLSALDQAIACCGAHIEAAAVRGLLGAFSLDSLETVSQALAAGDSRRMLDVVDELERNGHSLQHFSRELARYFRNLLVARISSAGGADSARLIAASPAERERLASAAAAFSEEDLTRYLQLSLDLFRDLQFSLQPRFHLELGLVRLVQAGRLLPIEQALANLNVDPGPRAPAPPPGPRAVRSPQPAPARTGPSPFEIDRAKKASSRPSDPESAGGPEPMAAGDWRQRLHAALMELGMAFTADAVEASQVNEVNNELRIVTSKAYSLALGPQDLEQAIRRIAGRPMTVKVTIGEAAPAMPIAPSVSTPAPAPAAGDASSRALENPEVKRFREVFGGEIRTIRNLKE